MEMMLGGATCKPPTPLPQGCVCSLLEPTHQGSILSHAVLTLLRCMRRSMNHSCKTSSLPFKCGNNVSPCLTVDLLRNISSRKIMAAVRQPTQQIPITAKDSSDNNLWVCHGPIEYKTCNIIMEMNFHSLP